MTMQRNGNFYAIMLGAASLFTSVVPQNVARADVWLAQHSNKALDIAGASQSGGAGAVQFDYHGGENQKFESVPAGNGFFMLRAKHSGQCLDVSGASQADAAPIIQFPCTGNDNQLWRTVEHELNLFEVRAKHSDKCLNVRGASGENGAQVIQFTCDGASLNALWQNCSSRDGSSVICKR